METRTANLIIGTSGGTAGGNATNYKLALSSTYGRYRANAEHYHAGA